MNKATKLAICTIMSANLIYSVGGIVRNVKSGLAKAADDTQSHDTLNSVVTMMCDNNNCDENHVEYAIGEYDSIRSNQEKPGILRTMFDAPWADEQKWQAISTVLEDVRSIHDTSKSK